MSKFIGIYTVYDGYCNCTIAYHIMHGHIPDKYLWVILTNQNEIIYSVENYLCEPTEELVNRALNYKGDDE